MAINLESALRSTISHGALSAGLAFSLTAISDTASAQQNQPQGQGGNVVLDTVEVETQNQAATEGDGSYTAQTASSAKQTAPLLNTPQTVTVVPRAIIQERGARDLTEVLRNTPGITFDGGENGFGTSMTNFKLRGFDTSGSVFIDGSRDNGTYARDTFNTDRVEIFKGPAADNGRGGAGGYVNMVTKSPILQNFLAGEIGFGFDEYDSKMHKRTTTDINYMVNPTTAIRINGMWEDSGVAGREIAENNAWGIAPSIAFGLGTNTRAIFSYEHLSRRDLPDWGIPAHAIPGMARFNPAAEPVSRDNFYGLRSDFDDADSDVLLARFEYDFSNNTTISNQTRWARVNRTSRFTTFQGNPFGAAIPVSYANVNTQNLFYDRTTETLTNLTNFSTEFFTGSFKHNLTMGVELSREESDANRQANANLPGNTSYFDPDPNRHPGFPLNPTQRNSVDIDTVAAYLYDTIQLNRHWQLTGGLRAEHYRVKIGSKTVPGGAPLAPFDGFEESDTTLGGKIGLVYKPVENGSYYASVGVSHMPPGSYLSNPDISRTGDDSAFPNLIPGTDPVRLINYEIGTKWDFFDGRLQTTAALFHTEKRLAIAPGGTFAGYGYQIVQGLELGVAGNITDRWKMFGGLLFMDSERKHNGFIDAALDAASGNDYRYLGIAANPKLTTSVNGQELAFTPKVSGNLWTTYRFDAGWTVGGGVQYVGSSWAGRPDDAQRIVANGAYGKLPAYFLTHLMASYEIRKDVEIRFNVDNIFDKKYAASTNWPAQRVMLGAPRTYRVSASYRF